MKTLDARGDKDEFADLRSFGASAIAGFLRTGAPVIGEFGEKLAREVVGVGIKKGVEPLLNKLRDHLRARLKPEQFDLFVSPHEVLARALAEGLRKVAGRGSLIVFLDTYEIVDRADPWLREVIKAAGPRVVWVIGGRNDLVRSRQFGKRYFKGYADDFPRRLLAYDVRQLALAHLKDYFKARVPERELTEEEAEALSQVTRGIPLAIRQAAEIWKTGATLEALVGDGDLSAPLDSIVQKMTDRYMLHAVAPEDQQALYALALAQGDVEVLRAMLRPEEENEPFDLPALLHRLERDYASVHIGKTARLHDEPALFLRNHLKAEVLRTEPWIHHFIERACDVIRERIGEYEAELPLIEDRCEDEDWVKAAIDLTAYLFWIDETEAWKWLAPRFVEGLAYSFDLRNGLTDVAADWRDHLSARGKKRLKRLQGGWGEEEAAMLDELERLRKAGWLDGEGKDERRSILLLRRGELLYRQERYQDVLENYRQAERLLPQDGTVLKERLADGLDDIGWKLGVKKGIPRPSMDAQSALKRATTLCPEEGKYWVGLGVMQDGLKKYPDAAEAIERGIALGEDEAWAHNGLGNVYRDQGRYEEALSAYNRALELDPEIAIVHLNLGNVYSDQGRYEEALSAFDRALKLDPEYV
ncbi:MAG: tetratricopeptide repeat protein, partial [Rhodothermales bacterium]